MQPTKAIPSQLETHTLKNINDKKLWLQFQFEARANKISTASGVKEMLRCQHEHQQQTKSKAAAAPRESRSRVLIFTKTILLQRI
jgi:hypothetical protein